VKGFVDHLYTQLGTTYNNSAIADLHALQFTVTHALGFSVFTSRILATDLSVCHLKSHMKSPLQRLIPFAISSHGLPSPELGSVLILAA
jgi:hypothetical protein